MQEMPPTSEYIPHIFVLFVKKKLSQQYMQALSTVPKICPSPKIYTEFDRLSEHQEIAIFFAIFRDVSNT